MEYTEQELIELFEELAAIREFDGNMRRDLAEKAAYWDWRKIVGNKVKVPEEIKKLANKFRQD